MAKNIEQRGNTWYATLHVPEDVRHKIGKAKLFQSLKTTDKREAEKRRDAIIAQWKARIAAARGQSDPFLEAALMWRKEHSENEHPDVIRDFIEEEAQKVAERQGPEAGKTFYALATGIQTPMETFFTEWATHLTQAPKTIDQMKKDVRRMIDKFVSVEAVTKPAVMEWVKELMKDTPTRQRYSYSSLDRMFKFCRNFWRYLQEIEKADPEKQPFVLPSFAKKTNGSKTKGTDGWEPFEPSEVVTLLDAATEKEDHELADLIRLGMYSGARIEELCALKVTDCTDEVLKITDSKTDAGIRRVPLHSELVEVVKRLKEASRDSYLLSGLTFNKYGDRSNAIGKRFGRLKKSLGFPDKKVFHSIRKTVVTVLEDAGGSENLTADIVGHEKPRITYGLYSGGHSVERMKEAIEKVRYPNNQAASC
ncbi:MAG: tyrosine-type recombinase/integrase [Nitrospira sp.]|nr:tyrosine-type recombinase/integrase [Nitrospira sp.]